MNKKIAALGGSAIVIGSVIALSACGSSAPTPSSTLTGGGYTVIQTYDQNQLPSSLVNYATSGAVGDSSSNVEVVLQLTSQGRNLAPAIEGAVENEYPGVTVTLDGDMLVAVAPLSDASEFGTS